MCLHTQLSLSYIMWQQCKLANRKYCINCFLYKLQYKQEPLCQQLLGHRNYTFKLKVKARNFISSMPINSLTMPTSKEKLRGSRSTWRPFLSPDAAVYAFTAMLTDKRLLNDMIISNRAHTAKLPHFLASCDIFIELSTH